MSPATIVFGIAVTFRTVSLPQYQNSVNLHLVTPAAAGMPVSKNHHLLPSDPSIDIHVDLLNMVNDRGDLYLNIKSEILNTRSVL